MVIVIAMATPKAVAKALKEFLSSEDFLSAISEAVENKLDEIIVRLKNYDDRLLKLETISKEANKERCDLQAHITESSNRIGTHCDLLESTVLDLQNDKDSSSRQITSMKKNLELRSDEIMGLHRQINTLEQYSRRSCIRIFGIKETPNENTDEIAVSVASKMGVNIGVNQIDRSHRVGKTPKDQKRSRGIIVKLCSYRTRQLLIRNRRKLKDTGIGIYEDLTPSNIQLLHEVKNCEKVTSSWTSDGKVFALTTASNGSTMKHIIHSKEDLLKI